MNRLTIILLFAASISYAQSQTETHTQRLLGKWRFEQFEDVTRSGDKIIVKKTGFAHDSVSFIFNENHTLNVNFSAAESQTFTWTIRKDLLEISSENEKNAYPKIVGVFEVHYLDSVSRLFLQRKNKPHNGIMLKGTTAGNTR
jgi:glycogen debranching enzyme